jgi:predicted ArsR family transcriptional regulator
VRDPPRYLRALVHHRHAREAAILQRLAEGDDTIPQMVARLYESIDKRLHGAAAMNVFAHLEDLVGRGLVESEGPPRPAGRYSLR